MSQDTVFVILTFIVIAVLFLFRETPAGPVAVMTAAEPVNEQGPSPVTYYNVSQPSRRDLV